MVEKKFSIIIPVYNGGKYLERCLVSVLKQDLSSDEYEVIVVDDGSSDGTKEILRVYSHRFPNLNVITKLHSGVGEARNCGCQKAIGKYFLFVDADDRIKANTLQQIYKVLEEEALDILVMAYRYLDNEGELQKEFNYISKRMDMFTDVRTGMDFMQKCLPPVVWASAYRASYWQEYNFSFLSIRHEDEELIPRVFYYAKRVKLLPINFYYYYRNSDSFMMNYNNEACLSMIQAMESLDCFRKECVKDKMADYFLQDWVAKRLLMAFKRGIRCGASRRIQEEMLEQMKNKGLMPLSRRKKGFHVFMYRYTPDLFITYYRIKLEKR